MEPAMPPCVRIAVVLCLALVGCAPMTFVVGVTPGDQTLTQTVVVPSGQWFAPRVAIVDVSGMIHNANRQRLFQRGENPVALLYEKLDKAQHDQRVKAIVLRLNTPGGTVTASDAMYRMIKRFKRRCQKPVVALMMDVAASGGYYVACACDKIVAHPTSITGSIGVIVQTVSLKPALARIGVQTESITTGPNKDAGSPLSVLTDQHRMVLQGMVDDFYQRFLDVVRRARPSIPPDQFDQLVDGRVLTGRQGALLGLVDHTGDLDDAVDLAKQLANIQQADVVLYHRPMTYVGSPYAMAHATGWSPAATGNTQINLAQINLPDTLTPPPMGFYYLWHPEHP